MFMLAACWVLVFNNEFATNSNFSEKNNNQYEGCRQLRNSFPSRHYVYVFQSECIGASDTGILHTKLFACNIHLVQFSYCG